MKTQIGAAALGLSLMFVPGLSLAGGQDVSGQDPSVSGGGGADTAAAAAVLSNAQVVSSLGGTFDTPAAAQALLTVQSALAVASPGSPEVAQALAMAIPSLISPAVAANPPTLTAPQLPAARAAVRTMIKALSDNGVTVPPELTTLRASLGAS
ncbi:hypothetical protein [Limimaricola cinnabarinus]|uniref:hypothetical protein n=1 Tax=Limimaricola cinnabarinus TaxID=1125964 RepID=UPI002492AFED|nr:hypothetical protein [Limimaricola cinnabarinus]